MAFDIATATGGGSAADYEKSAGLDKQPVTSNSLTVLRMLAEEQLAKEKEIADAEAALVVLKAELAVIKTKKLPEFMQEHDMPSFTFKDNDSGATMVVELDEVIRVSIPKGKKTGVDATPKALKFFRDNGHAGIISKELAVNVGLRDDATVAKLEEAVRSVVPAIDTRVDESVAPATVTKIITKRLKDGLSVPDDCFAIFRQTESSVSVK